MAHSEFNHSKTEKVHFLRIWIVPSQRGVAPRYQQAPLPEESKRGQFKLIISPDGRDGALSVHQDAHVCAGLFDGEEADHLDLAQGRFAYVHVARGGVTLNGVTLNEGDGARVRGEARLVIAHGNDAEVLAFSLRPREEPRPRSQEAVGADRGAVAAGDLRASRQTWPRSTASERPIGA